MALCLCLCACSDGETGGNSNDVAVELRALRVALQAQAERSAPTVVTFDKDALAQALAPLTQAMQTLATDQQQLRGQQQALIGELQRWATVVAGGLTAAQKEPQEQLAQLQRRLGELEQAMRAQDERHRQVQELLRKALEGTADRLDSFLQRLQAMRRDAAMPGDKVPDKGPDKGNDKPDSPSTTPPGDAGRRGQGASVQPGYLPRNSQRRLDPFTLSLLAAALGAVGFFVWRLRRPLADGVPVEHPVAAAQNSDELWAAAALLSEAVGRLKAVVPPAELAALTQPMTPPAPEAIEPGMPAPDDELYVIDDGSEALAQAIEPAPPAVPAVPGPPPPAATMPWQTLVLPTRRPELAAVAVRELLARDPRVLRRPAPVVTPGVDELRVELLVLPHLPAAELAQLHARLQALTG
jgi:hypothetical protein